MTDYNKIFTLNFGNVQRGSVFKSRTRIPFKWKEQFEPTHHWSGVDQDNFLKYIRETPSFYGGKLLDTINKKFKQNISTPKDVLLNFKDAIISTALTSDEIKKTKMLAQLGGRRRRKGRRRKRRRGGVRRPRPGYYIREPKNSISKMQHRGIMKWIKNAKTIAELINRVGALMKIRSSGIKKRKKAPSSTSIASRVRKRKTRKRRRGRGGGKFKGFLNQMNRIKSMAVPMIAPMFNKALSGTMQGANYLKNRVQERFGLGRPQRRGGISLVQSPLKRYAGLWRYKRHGPRWGRRGGLSLNPFKALAKSGVIKNLGLKQLKALPGYLLNFNRRGVSGTLKDMGSNLISDSKSEIISGISSGIRGKKKKKIGRKKKIGKKRKGGLIPIAAMGLGGLGAMALKALAGGAISGGVGLAIKHLPF
jgi:hypothetical protein